MADRQPNSPPVLNYSTTRPRRHWAVKIIALLMCALGVFEVAGAFLSSSVSQTTADQRVDDYNARVVMLFGFVLTIPAICLALGRFSDSKKENMDDEPP